jgi:hypothetical protein
MLEPAPLEEPLPMLEEPLPMLLSDWLPLPVVPWPLEPLLELPWCFLDFFFAL